MEPTVGPDDDVFILAGLGWLVQDTECLLVLYVPSINHIQSTYLATAIGEKSIQEIIQTRKFTFADREIDVIDFYSLKPINEKIRIMFLWGNDKNLKDIEAKYDIDAILAIPWVPEYDITKWRMKYNPQRIDVDIDRLRPFSDSKNKNSSNQRLRN